MTQSAERMPARCRLTSGQAQLWLFMGAFFLLMPESVRVMAAQTDLAPLRISIEAQSAAGDELHEQAARLLLDMAPTATGLEGVDAAIVANIRQIILAATAIARRAGGLAESMATDTTEAVARVAGLSDARAAYEAVKKDLDAAARELRARIEALRFTGALVHPGADRQAFMVAVERYVADANRLLAALDDLEAVLLPQMRNRPERNHILLSAYGFFDATGTANETHGLYTHVLFSRQSARSRALLDVILTGTGSAAGQPSGYAASMNLFAIPVKSRMKALFVDRISTDLPNDIAAPSIYDYERAAGLLGQICLTGDLVAPALCSAGWRGPYLLTHANLLTGANVLTPPLLLVDLSDVHQAAFGELVSAVKQQIMLPDFSSREKIDTLRLQLLTITLTAADWLDPIRESIAEIVSLGGSNKKAVP